MGMIAFLKAVSDKQIADIMASPDHEQFMPNHKNDPHEFDFDKSWMGIHYCLSGGDLSGGNSPVGFILGGEPIDLMLDYGPPRAFRADKVHEISQALSRIGADDFKSLFNPNQMNEDQVYPAMDWNEPEELEYLTDYYLRMKKFLAQSASSNFGMITYIF